MRQSSCICPSGRPTFRGPYWAGSRRRQQRCSVIPTACSARRRWCCSTSVMTAPGSGAPTCSLPGCRIWPDLHFGASISLKIPRRFAPNFFYNAQEGGRLQMLLQPWLGVWREITDKYLGLFSGLYPGVPKLLRVKLAGTLLIAAATAAVAFVPRLRRLPGASPVLGITGLFFLVLALLDGQKQYNTSFTWCHCSQVFWRFSRPVVGGNGYSRRH